MANTAADLATAEPASSATEVVACAAGRRRAGLGGDAAVAAGVIALGAAAVAVLLHLGRGTTFFFDEWDWVEGRRHGSVDALLRPHNGHLTAVPIAIYRVLFAAVGLRHYTAFRVTGIAFELLCVALVVLLVRRHLPPLVVLVAAAALLFYGPGWQDLLWPLQIAYTASIAGALGAVLLLRRRDMPSDVGAALCLTVSVASSGLGLPLLAGVAVLVLAARQWRRLWVIAVPAVLYGVWYLRYGESEVRLANVPKLPAYMLTTSGATVGGLFGLRLDYGRFLCGVLVALLVTVVARHRRVPPVFAFSVAAVVLMWAAFGLARGGIGEADASRYLYPGAVLIVLAAAEAPRRHRVHPAVSVALAIILPFTLWPSSRTLRNGAAGLRGVSQVVRVELGALEIAGLHADPGFQPDTSRMPQVFAGPYLSAVRALGSPAATTSAIEHSSEQLREDADAVLVAAYASWTEHSPAPPACPGGGSAVSTGLAFLNLPAGSALVVRAGPASSTRVWLRRLAGAFRPTPDATIAPGAIWVIDLARDPLALGWELRLAGPGASSCTAPG